MPQNQDVPSIIALYKKTAMEISRYRDLEWKITIWAVSLFMAIVSITRVFSIPEDIMLPFQIGFTIFTVLAVFAFIYYIHHCHLNLTRNRIVFRKCEISLHVDELLYESWRKAPESYDYTNGLTHLLSWWILIILSGSFAVFAIWHWTLQSII